MPRYRVEALEKFLVRTVYHVEADSPWQAEAVCKEGKAAYDHKSIEEGDEEWIETVSVSECDGTPD
jgi:hypothetical protein